MATSLPKLLSGAALYVDGVAFVGNATVSLPNIQMLTEEVNAAGLGGAFDIPTGRLQKLDATVSVMDVPPALMELVGNPDSVNREVLAVRTMTDGSEQRVESFSFFGFWREQNDGGNGAGAGAGDNTIRSDLVVSIRRLTHKIDGVEKRHIDLIADVHRIGGEDVSAERRRALASG